ncbi:MAG: ankyrin repeat domain-containing protein, partial [Alphaproteobacteria bacterium]
MANDNNEYQNRIKTYGELSVALFIATIQGDIKEMEKLLDKGAGVDGTCQRPGSIQQESILGAAVREDRREAAELLIKRGANVNMIGPDGRTALHIAVRYGHADMTALLIKNGADRNMTFTSETVYDIAARAPQQAAETISALLEGYNRQTLGKIFRDVARRGNVKTLHVIAAKEGFDVEDADHNGNTALLMIAENAKDCINAAAAIEALISLGANVEAENYFRETPLSVMMAKKDPSPEAVRALIKGGADILRETLAGYSNYEAALL